MELHEHFMSLSASGSTIFEIISNTPVFQDTGNSIISKFIEQYFEKLKADDVSKKHLEILRMLLCHQYKINYEQLGDDKTRILTKFNQFMEFMINSKLYPEKENQRILYDITVLLLILCEDQKNFVQLFEDFRASFTASESLTTSKISTERYLKVLNCFLKAWDILNFLSEKKEQRYINKTHFDSCKKVLLSSVMYDLQTWINCNNCNEWNALHALLTRIIKITKNNRILSPYVHEILDKHLNLTTLCFLSDFIFPLNSSGIDVDYSTAHHKNLWTLIQSKLVSTYSQERKQALYLIKRLIDFIDRNEENIKEVVALNLMPNKMNPFVCNRREPGTLPIKCIRTNFIIIMEALEEKQKHLIIPCLSHINSLIEGHTQHKSCGNCFDSSWMYCIFARLLKHDNSAIVKWGLIRSLKLNEETYTCDYFFILIVKTLNNTFLYEKYNDESEPEVVTALTNWFNTFHNENLRLIEIFIHLLPQESWGPVAIFYILHSLLSVSNKLDDIVNLEPEQFHALKELMHKSINLHPPMLRSMSQITLIKILSRFANVQNLMSLSHLLSVFSQKDMCEPTCWSALVLMLGKVNYNSAVSFINEICDILTVDDENVRIMPMFAIIIQLLYEGKVICQTEQCTAAQRLTTLLLCLDRVDVRPYVKVSFIVKIINVIYSLFDLKREPPAFIYKYFMNYNTIFKFILKLFNNANFDYEDLRICTRALQNIEYYSKGEVNSISILSSYDIKDLEIRCIQVLSNVNEHNDIQFSFALQLWSNISNYLRYDDKFLLENINNLLEICKCKNHSNELSGKISLDNYIALSKLIKNHVQILYTDDLPANKAWFQIMSSILDVAGNEVLIYFSDIVQLYSMFVNNNPKILEDVTLLVRSFWSCNFASKRNKTFWLVHEKLTQCINSSNFLCNEALRGISKEFTGRLLNEGDLLPGLKHILLTYSDISGHFNNFMETVLNGLLHGPVMRRDQRINMQTCMNVKQLLRPCKLIDGKFENLNVYDFISRQYNLDAAIRAAAVIQLCKALNDNNERASLFLPLVLEKLSAIQNKRYYADSQLHRLKHRIMQTLLLLHPYLDESSTIKLYNMLRDSLMQDTDQHSVRIMKEWLLIRIYILYKNLIPDLWKLFDKICNERPGSSSSIISITWHVAQHLPEEMLEKFVKMALTRLAVCCMGQQFGMRLYGQVFFTKLYKLLNQDSKVRLEYRGFYKIACDSINSGTFRKNPIKIDDHFFYTVFNAIKDYSLETIYYELPRLSNVSCEEWIVKEYFDDQIFLNNTSTDIKIINCDNLLNEAKIPYSILKSGEHSKPEEIECSEFTTDIQKKITPWKTMLPNEEELTQISDSSNTINTIRIKQDIIIVASFVDKPQNLGGIARTCEIFGVKELVISNLKLIEDKEFQALSVSADKWMKITEVKPFSIAQYLLELKDCGWTLIGAEQTAQSVNLYDMKFPKQTVLILGNEKNGIPANIIPLLDVCTEISQFGVIRSLNVHVTTAICIWEYTTQHQYVA